MNKKIALFDLDGSLADFDASMRAKLAELDDGCHPLVDGSLHAMEKYPHMSARIEMIKSIPGFWRDLPRIEAGIDLYRLCEEMGFETHVLTKAPRRHPQAWAEKVQWAQQNLDCQHIHLVTNKGLVYGHVLFDDFPPYMEQWLEHRKRGLGIMPNRPWNEDFRHANLVRYDPDKRWPVMAALETVLARQPKELLRLPK